MGKRVRICSMEFEGEGKWGKSTMIKTSAQYNACQPSQLYMYELQYSSMRQFLEQQCKKQHSNNAKKHAHDTALIS